MRGTWFCPSESPVTLELQVYLAIEQCHNIHLLIRVQETWKPFPKSLLTKKNGETWSVWKDIIFTGILGHMHTLWIW